MLDESISHQPTYPVGQRARYGLALPDVVQLLARSRGNAQHPLDIPTRSALGIDHQHALQQLNVAQALNIIERQTPDLGHGIEHHRRPVHLSINGLEHVMRASGVKDDFDDQSLVALLDLGIRLAHVRINTFMVGRQRVQQGGVHLRIGT